MSERSSADPDPGARPGSDTHPAAGAPVARRRSAWIGGVAALLATVVALYIWKLVAVADVRGEMTAERDSLHARAVRALDARTAELLRVSVVPLGWAIRSEMLRRDYGRVEAFLNEFVQEPGVRRAVLAVPGDSILLATDKDLEGRAFSAHFAAELLRVSEPRVVAGQPGGGYRIAVPILGPTRSLGVLVVDFRPEEVLLLVPSGPEAEGRSSRADPEGEPAPAPEVAVRAGATAHTPGNQTAAATPPGSHATIRPSIAEATQVSGLAR